MMGAMEPDDLLASRRRADALIERLVELCAADERIVAAFLGGSRARGEDDAFSDVDVSLIVADDAYDEVMAERADFVRRLGDAPFIEEFGTLRITFVIFADGTDLELYTFRASDLGSIRSGPHRVLLDKTGILEGVEFPVEEEDDVETRTEDLRRILFWFWHDVGHFKTAIGRDQLWWAAGQLEALRNYCVNLERLGQGGANMGEPYWKLEAEISTEPLEPLRVTFVPLERDAMLRAGRAIVAFFRERGTIVAQMRGLTYPADLDAVVSDQLEHLADPR